MSMSWENVCVRCGKNFDSWCREYVCSKCWTVKDTENECKNEEEKTWKFRAEKAERKLSKLPKWLINWL